MQRPRQVVMIDDVVPVLRPEHDWDHMLAEKLVFLLFALVMPALALLLDLPNADRHLGRAQVCDRNRLENGFANRHGGLLTATKLFGRMGLLEGVIYALLFDENKLANHAAGQHRGRRDTASNRSLLARTTRAARRGGPSLSSLMTGVATALAVVDQLGAPTNLIRS